MNRIIAIAYLVFFCIAYSCNSGSDLQAKQDAQNQLSEREFYDFDIRNHLDKPGELLLSSIASEIRYIPLETTPACLLSRCRSVEIFNNNMYILDTKALYQFDMDGSFIRQIGKIGNGPGEYGSVLWFNFIDSTNEIVLYSYPTGRINVYDAEPGEFKRSFKLDFDSNGIVEFPPGELAFFTWNDRQSEDPTRRSEIYICNLEGDIFDSIPDERVPFSGNIVSPSHYYVFNESLHYMEFFEDTLYSLSENKVKDRYASFGLRNKVDVHQLELKNQIGVNQFPDFLRIDEVLETERSFFITIEKGLGLYIPEEFLKIFYNKESGQIVNCTSIINDLDNGWPFWPKSVYKDSVLIDYCPAIEFLEYFQANTDDQRRTESLKYLIKSVDENDNPIIILTNRS